MNRLFLQFFLSAILSSFIFAKSKPRHLPHYNDVRFTCANGRSIEARFYLDGDGTVKLRLSDGRKWELPRVMAASGVRYATSDDAFIFWTKGNEAFVLENDIITYRDCTTP